MRIKTTLSSFSRLVSFIDLIILLVFLGYAFVYFMGVWNSIYPLGLVTGDAANIAAFVAARTYPEAFVRDFAFNNIKNFQFYTTIHLPLLAFLHRILNVHLGKAFLLLLPFQIFLQLAGFYVLGRILFKSRVWAIIFSVLNSITYWSPGLADYWGIFPQPQPRFLFQALLPALIIPAIMWRNNPAKWPYVMIIAGLLVYVHPVSAPAWAFSVWLGFAYYLPSEWSMARKANRMLGLGMIFIGLSSFFIYNYLASHTSPKVTQYDELFSIMLNLHYYFMNPGKASVAFITENQYPLLLIAGFFGAIITLWSTNYNKERSLSFVWLIGIVFVSVIIPIVEHTIARWFRVLPYELDLIRGVRFLYPFLIYFSIQGMIEITGRYFNHPIAIKIPSFGRTAISPLMVCFVTISILAIVNLSSPSLTEAPKSAISCWQQKRFTCPSSDSIEIIKTVEKIKENVPQGEVILPIQIPFHSLIIRYYSLRSIAFCGKDQGITSYTNPELFLKWNEIKDKLSDIGNEQKKNQKIEKSIDLAKELGAEYLLVGFKLPKDRTGYVVKYHNATLGVSLIRIVDP